MVPPIDCKIICKNCFTFSCFFFAKKSVNNTNSKCKFERSKFDRHLQDLNDSSLVIRALTELYQKKKPLRCDVCGKNRKSVVGFLSHKSQCTKSDYEIEDMKVKCHLCDRKMLPVSLPRHLELTHQEVVVETPTKPKKAENEPVATHSKRKAANKYVWQQYPLSS